jgi:phage tail sheath gpL-like
MATVSLVVKTTKDPTKFTVASKKHRNLNLLINLLSGLSVGALRGSVDIHASTSDPVAADGYAVLTYASIANNDTIVIGDQTLTCVTGTPTTDQFKKETSASVTGDNLVAAIAANSTLNALVSAANASGTVTLTSRVKGSIGNAIRFTTSNGTGFAITGFRNGTGGPSGSAETFAR